MVTAKNFARFRKINPLSDERWDYFVSGCDNGTFYHTSPWLRAIEKTYAYEPICYALENSDGNIVAGIPLFKILTRLTGGRLVSLPFTDFCSPLGGEKEVAELIRILISDFSAAGIKYIELRSGPESILGQKSEFKRHDNYKRFTLYLDPDVEKVRKLLHPTAVRRPINQAQKSGLRTFIADREEHMRAFFKLNMRVRRRHGMFPQPYSFFSNIWFELLTQGYGFLIVAADASDTILAGSVFFTHGKGLFWKFNASDPSNRQYRPNHLILWEAIKMACNDGLNYVDFGRTSSDNQGLLDFKRRWGAVETDLPYYYYPRILGVTSTVERGIQYRLLRNSIRHLPVSVLELVGERLYKHLG